MYRTYYSYPYSNATFIPQQKHEERFIGPIFPFLGGALIGYIAGRPQYNYSYPVYYPYYYPYYPTYYQRPHNNIYDQNKNVIN